MTIRRSVSRSVGPVCTLLAFAFAGSVSAQVPGGCNMPVSERANEVGCYLSATQDLGTLPDAPLFWHLYTYPTSAAAKAANGSRGTVVEAFGKVWLYTIAGADWRPLAGERVAVIGPLKVVGGKQYIARYMEATFTPGMRAAVHRHSGPEAWYLVAGTQCLETPDRVTIAHAGEGAVVPEGPPMALSSVGTDIRRSVLLVLHDKSQPWITMASDWQPKGLCPQ